MKRSFIFLVFSLLSAGCDMLRPDVSPTICLDPDQEEVVLIPGVGASYDVKFTSASSWTAGFLYADDPVGWASVSDTVGTGGHEINKLSFAAEKNRSGKRRTVWLVIRSGLQSKNILFTQGPYVSGLPDEDLSGGQDSTPPDQGGNGGSEGKPDGGNSGDTPVFRLSESTAQVGAAGGTIYVTVQTNVKYECKLSSDWVIEVRSRSYDEYVHIFEVLPNKGTEERSYTISFCGNGTCVPFTVVQAAAEN